MSAAEGRKSAGGKAPTALGYQTLGRSLRAGRRSSIGGGSAGSLRTSKAGAWALRGAGRRVLLGRKAVLPPGREGLSRGPESAFQRPAAPRAPLPPATPLRGRLRRDDA